LFAVAVVNKYKLYCYKHKTASLWSFKTERLARYLLQEPKEGIKMARRNRDDDLLLEEDELTAAFLGDEAAAPAQDTKQAAAGSPVPDVDDEWDEEDQPMGQLAVDVYETREKLVVKARTAGVNKNDLDVSISDNQLTVRGTLSSGSEEGVENYFLQECYWGEFSRTIALPVPVKEEEIEAVLKDGVLTISFSKVQQDTVKKIQVL
jgi:HSP20 family protein